MEMDTNIQSENTEAEVLLGEDNGDSKKVWIAVIVVLILLAAYLIFFNKSSEEVDLNNVQEVSQEEAISAFPLGLPIEEGIEADESYKFIPEGSSEEQFTISYVSGLSFEDNTTRFADFLAKEDYDILNETNELERRFFYAQKTDNDLSITIEEIDLDVFVTISNLER